MSSVGSLGSLEPMGHWTNEFDITWKQGGKIGPGLAHDLIRPYS